jgi:hypothetical protein
MRRVVAPGEGAVLRQLGLGLRELFLADQGRNARH